MKKRSPQQTHPVLSFPKASLGGGGRRGEEGNLIEVNFLISCCIKTHLSSNLISQKIDHFLKGVMRR
jgi:hypothetical protein